MCPARFAATVKNIEEQDMHRNHIAMSRIALILTLLACFGFVGASTAEDGRRLKLVHPMDVTEGLNLGDSSARLDAAGPEGEKVLRCDGYFAGRIDLGALGIDPRDYDTLMIEAKGGRGVFTRVSLENYPGEGELSHWYVLDGARGPFDWKTIRIDLRKPEEIKPPRGDKGMASKDTSLRGLQFMGRPGRGADQLLLGRIRIVKKAIDLDWDQRKAPYTWGKGKDLIFEYPLELTNRTQKSLTAKLWTEPFEVTHAKAELAEGSVELTPGQTKTVTARVSLPASVAAEKDPLYTERFTVFAEAEGLEDSRVTITRSSDPIHLVVTVPIPEEKLSFPLFPVAPKSLPQSVVQFAVDPAKKALAKDLDSVLAASKEDFIRNTGYMELLASAGYLYNMTGERQYFAIARKLLEALPEIWRHREAEFLKKEVQPIAYCIVSPSALDLGWRIGGTQRPPYFYGLGGNGRFGNMSSIAYVFDFLAPELDEKLRQHFVQEFLLPAAVRARNHYVGPNNMQLTQGVAVLYGGLAARNWPLVAFAHNAEHGLMPLLTWAFGEDGLLRGETEHHTYAVNPLLWTTELLYGVGVDLYGERLHTIVHSRSAEALKKSYIHKEMAAYIDQSRFAGKEFLEELKKRPRTDGDHLKGGTSWLKWQGIEVIMNWGRLAFRGCPAYAALLVRGKGLDMGGVVEDQGDRSLFGNSIIIVDELYKHPSSKALAFDVTGPVQYIQATSEESFRDWNTTRTVALIDEHVLVVDRVSSNKPRTVDWLLRNMSSAPALELEERKGSFTDKPKRFSQRLSFGAEMKNHHFAQTDRTWRSEDGRLTMAAAPATRLYAFRWYKAPTLMVRRQGVKKADFVALVSKQSKSIEQVSVKRADGKDADAVGVKITLADGKTFHAIVNYEPEGTEVTLGTLKTRERFATDYDEAELGQTN